MFKTRLASAIILLICLFGLIIPGGMLLLAGLYIISIIAFMELMKALGIRTEGKLNQLEVGGMLFVSAYYGYLLWNGPADLELVFCLILIILLMFVYVFTFPKFQAEQIMCTVFSIFYAPVMLSFIYRTRKLSEGIFLVWMIFISSWVCDTAAYIVGRLFGKHKMAPVLSPKKSIEGAVGGVVGAALVGALYAWLIVEHFTAKDGIIIPCAIICGVGGLISQVVDLAASAIKRNKEIKDYGKLIPGHGGIMDRFDSVIFTAPITYLLARIILGLAG